MDGKLYLAPVKQPKRVIDLATGTGIWAIDFADEHPDVELVLGNDLSPIQPSWVPPNVKFVVDDVESEWSYEKPFDFIHGRYLAGSISDWPKLMSQAYANLQSGGWVEFQDYDLNVRVDDNSLDGTVVAQLHDLICGACEKLGRTAAPGPKLKGWVEGAGFDNVKEVVYKLPLGPWTKDAKLKHAGGLNLSQCLSGLEAFTLRLFTSVLGWTTDEIHAFLVDARRDLNLKRIHPYMTL
ncbi:MAG: hypothetical protein M1819_005501 [Sarea resinae]|nr:MAG: hypothetical protein M1819_005501 [Sarea resinae]